MSDRCRYDRFVRHLLAFLVVFTLAWGAGSSPASGAGKAGPADRVPDEILIKLKTGSTFEKTREVQASVGGQQTRRFPGIGVEQWKIEGDLDAVLRRLNADESVEYAEPNFLHEIISQPNDPLFSLQWSLRNTGQSGGTPRADIGATRAWDFTTGDPTVLVGVIDTGVGVNHPDLAANIFTNPGEVPGDSIDNDQNGKIDDVHGYDFADNDADPTPTNHHGTHVAGIIGAVGNNALGVTGVAWTVKIVPLKCAKDSDPRISNGDVMDAIDYAIAMGVDILNNSYGSYDSFSQALAAKIQQAHEAGIVFVCGAGNDASDNDVEPFFYPASYDAPNVISVAASDDLDQRASFSNFGATTVDLAAPGDEVFSTMGTDSYAYNSGTSMASPMVAGALALLKSHLPAASVTELIQRLYAHVDPVSSWEGLVATGGRLNIGRAVVGEDLEPPDAITNVATDQVSSNWVRLKWTVPEDDGFLRRPASYDIRYSTVPINAANFAQSPQAPSPAALAEFGAQQLATVSGLATSTRYYFAVKGVDEAAHVSGISNVIPAVTLKAPVLAYSPSVLSLSLVSGVQGYVTLTIRNVGSGGLDYQVQMPTDPWVQVPYWTVPKMSGTVNAGMSTQLAFRLDSYELPAGLNQSAISFTTNDPLRPQVSVPVRLTVSNDPDISVAASLSLGSRYPGNSAEGALSVYNAGPAVLTVAASENHADYAVSPATLSIGSHQTGILNVTFTPHAVGTSSTSLTLTTNDPNEATVGVSLSGLGMAPPVLSTTAITAALAGGTSSAQSITVTNPAAADIRWSVLQVAGSTVATSIAQDLPAFTGVHVLFSAAHSRESHLIQREIWFDVADDGAILDGEVGAVTPQLLAGKHIFWLIQPDNTWATPEVQALKNWILDGGTLLVDARFGPQTFLNSLFSDLGANLHVADQYDGSAGTMADVLPHGATTNVHSIHAQNALTYLDVVEFPSSPLVRDPQGRVRGAVSRVGRGRILVTTGHPFDDSVVDLADNRKFGYSAFRWLAENVCVAAQAGGDLIAAGDSSEISVVLDASHQTAGARSATFLVWVWEPDEWQQAVTVDLTTTGSPAVRPESDRVDFGTVYIGYAETQGFDIRNEGWGLLQVAAVTSSDSALTAIEAPEFLWPEDTGRISLQYDPTVAGPLSATVDIATDDPVTPVASLPALGTALEPPIVTVSPDSVATSVNSGDLTTVHLALRNDGGSPLDWTLVRPRFRVGFDLSHGQSGTEPWSGMFGRLASNNWAVSTLTGPLTPSALEELDALWIAESSVPLAPSEVTAVRDWVFAGGGLFLEAGVDGVIPSHNELLVDLGAGLSFSSTDGTVGTTRDIVPHNITVGITALSVAEATASLGSPVLPGRLLTRDIGGAAHSACSQVGDGRIVAVAAPLTRNGTVTREQNGAFAIQVFNWLGAVRWLTISPGFGSLPAGGTALVALNLQGTGILSGEFGTMLELTSNDPATPRLSVPVSLIVYPAPDLTADPLALVFEDVPIGQAESRWVSLTNTGAGTLEVASIESNDPTFTASPAVLSLPQGETETIEVRFQPVTPGTVAAALSIASNDPTEPIVTINLTGTGVVAPELELSPPSIAVSLPAGGFANAELTLANSGGGILDWSIRFEATPDTVLAAPIRVLRDLAHGQNASATWTKVVGDLVDRGAEVETNADVITVDRLADFDVFWTTDSDVALWSPSEIDAVTEWVEAGGGLFLHNRALQDVGGNQGEFEIVRLSLADTLMAHLDTGLGIDGADAARGLASEIAEHRVTNNVDQMYFTVPYARIIVEPPALMLAAAANGPVQCAVGAAGMGRVAAVACDFLQDSQIDNRDHRRFANQVFDWLAGGRWLAAYRAAGGVASGTQQQVDITVDASDLAPGSYSASLILETDDPDESEVTIPVSVLVDGANISHPGSLAFGEVFEGVDSVDSVWVKNVGTDTLNVSSWSVSGPHFTAESPAPMTLLPGQKRYIDVTFTPAALGALQDTLQIASDDPDEPLARVILSGLGVDPYDVEDPPGKETETLRIPEVTVLHPASPTPFRARTQIRFDLSRSGHVNMVLFDVAGRQVRTLVDGPESAGYRRVEWDARDDRGIAVAPGMYFCRFTGAGVVSTQRLLLLR